MSFVVNIEEFEGPLDLMLYLIRENKLDLFDLDLVTLTNQYISFIHQAQDQQLIVASEYLSEMASLIELKSRRLLPRPTTMNEDQEELNDPRSLVSRLLEYQRFKDASLDLSKRFIERQQQVNLFNTSSVFLQENQQEVVYQHDIYDLIKAMNRVIARQQATQMAQVTYTKTEYSIDDRIEAIRYQLRTKKDKFNLSDLFDQEDDLEFKIVTFLAVLDMILMKELIYSINKSTDEIALKGV